MQNKLNKNKNKMIREQIKQEVERLGWTGAKLAEKSGVRYPSISEFLAGRKELETPNLEKVLKALNLKIKRNGSMLPEYGRMLSEFDGNEIPYSSWISEEYFSTFLFGVLVRKASEALKKEVKSSVQLTLGNIFDYFVVYETDLKLKETYVDIHKSLQKHNFIRICANSFSEKEKKAYAFLLVWEYPENCDRGDLDSQFMGGLFSDFDIKIDI